MKVCDKCRKELTKGNKIDLLDFKVEICDDCAKKIVQWLKQPIKKNIIGDLFFK